MEHVAQADATGAIFGREICYNCKHWDGPSMECHGETVKSASSTDTCDKFDDIENTETKGSKMKELSRYGTFYCAKCGHEYAPYLENDGTYTCRACAFDGTCGGCDCFCGDPSGYGVCHSNDGMEMPGNCKGCGSYRRHT